MSRQSKNANNMARAKQITAMHKNGEKGPSSTAPKHEKKWGYRTNPEVLKRIAELAKGPGDGEKTSAKKILAKAGGASKDQAEA